MQCPLCLDSPLEPKFVGVTEVDICPRCRGIWLDRGELDRLLGDAPAARPRHDDDRDDRKPKGKKKTTTAKRLADLFEEVLDF